MKIFDTQEYIKNTLCDPWLGTEFEGYKSLDPKQKGNLGEAWLSNYMERTFNSIVKDADCGVNGPYDRIIDKYNTEIKFGLSHSDNKKQIVKSDVFSINHVSVGKCWDRLIFCGINLIDGIPTPNRISWCTKEDFVRCLKLKGKDRLFNPQQGGNKGGNDDYICAGKKPMKWINSEYSKDISEW
jgi:hypothetical protein|tara:strand:+ start:1083 stop:1634 length:552 start_codon:yes stop_codon:yes gene_type:complete